MCHAIKFYSNHYRALISRFKSFKVGRISSLIARFRHLFLFLQPLLIRVGPLLYLFPLHYISTYYFKCFGVCGSEHMAEGGSERHLAVRISEILARKYKFITYLYAKVISLVQAIRSVYKIDFGIRLKVSLCTMS